MVGCASAQVDYFIPARILQFADYLYGEKQFARAAGEYERYLVAADSTGRQDSVLFRIGYCLRKASQPEPAVDYFRRAASAGADARWRDEAAYQSALTWLESGRPVLALAVLESVPHPARAEPERFRDLRALNYAYLKDWRKADSLMAPSLKPQPPSLKLPADTSTWAIGRLAHEGIRLSRTSPALAGAMSAVIPGLGKVYAGRIPDALFSLATIGLTAWQAVDGFHQDGIGSVRGWIYGTLAVGFYAGDIWGSVVAAWQRNERAEQNLLKRAGTLLEQLDR